MDKKIGKILLFVFPVLLFVVLVVFLAPKQDPEVGESVHQSIMQVDGKKENSEQQEPILAFEMKNSNFFEYTFAGSPYIYVVFEIENTGNVNLELDVAEFCLYDQSGNLIDVTGMSQAYPNIIKPGEVAYYADAIANNYEFPISQISLQHKYRATDKSCRYLDVSNDSLVNKETGVLKGALTVTNNSGKIAGMVHSFFVLRDKSRQLVALLTGVDYENIEQGASFSTTVHSLTLDAEVLEDAGYTGIHHYAFAFAK